ncbi:uncharacterized protein LOC118648727 [Monomorium pharaonis]|uniref:uncharacterized protein LOC118648727 n=1 Tax=Monomorium pharaonis TaxID=307658 RepID=UPI00174666F9|nr:uncharacterized protein LOC118648727 [Monomorium pharaonis]
MPVDHSPKHASGSEKSANEFRNVKLAAFWRNRPKLWFAAIECEFTAYRIRSDEIKYSAVVRHLDEHSMIAVADILEQPPTTGTNVTDNMLRTLWLQRLPPRIQELLAVLDEVSLDKLAACADKAHDRGAGHGTIASTSVSQPDSMQTLNNQISKLTKSVAAIGKRRARTRSRESLEMPTPMRLETSLSPTGKLQQPPAIGAVSDGYNQRRLHVKDQNSGLRFLVDTGADISLLPKKAIDRKAKQSALQLYAARVARRPALAGHVWLFTVESG